MLLYLRIQIPFLYWNQIKIELIGLIYLKNNANAISLLEAMISRTRIINYTINFLKKITIEILFKHRN